MVAIFTIYEGYYLILGIEDNANLSFVKNPRKLNKLRRRIYLLSLREKLKKISDKIFQLRFSRDYSYIKTKVELLAKIHATIVPNSQYPFFHKYLKVIPRKLGLKKYKKEIYLADSVIRYYVCRSSSPLCH